MATLKRTYGRKREHTPIEHVDDDTPPTSQHSALALTPKSKTAFLLAKEDDVEVSQTSQTTNPFTLESEDDPAMEEPVEPRKLFSVSQIMQDEDSEDDDLDAYIRLRKELMKPAETQSRADRLQALAQKKRDEASEEAAQKVQSDLLTTEQTSGSDSEDIEAEMRMSSAKRAPRRQASKKAIEEMHKETERLQRNMTLAPEANVHTKLKISDFLARLGYKSIAVEPQHEVTDKPQVESTDEPAEVVDDRPTAFTTSFAKELEESDDDEDMPEPSTLMQAPVFSSPPAPVPQIYQDIVLSSESEVEDCLPGHLKAHKQLFAKRDKAKIQRDRKAAKFVAMARPESPTKLHARAEKQRREILLASVAQQAKLERAEREAALKAAGVNIVSAAERQKEAIEIEDLVEKARRQAEELRQLEKKEDQKRKAAEDGLNDESEQDDDWDGDQESVMNSETDGDESEDDENSDDNEENVAEPVEDPEHIAIEDKGRDPLRRTDSVLSEIHIESDDELSLVQRKPTARTRIRRVLDEDSEDDKENAEPVNAAKTPGPGLTQFFDPTQADLHDAPAEFSVTQFLASPKESAAVMDRLRGSEVILASNAFEKKSPFQADEVIPSSQPDIDIPVPHAATQFSVFDPPSPDQPVTLVRLNTTDFTQATEVDDFMNESQDIESPKRLGRLRKANTVEAQTNPFRRMRQAINEEDQQKSRKAFVDDRAVESDDEYAGLGGASDEEPEDSAAAAAELEEMIDRDAQDEDEEGQRKIAAFYAQKDLENDEKMVNTLMNDINNGGLRRRRGAGLLDMEDSEDEEEEAARYKARQALMRARLLESQNLATLADNPKTRAFIEAMEDRATSASFIEISGEVDLVPETQEVEEQAGDTPNEPMPPPLGKKKRRPIDIRSELSFLDDENDSQPLDFDPTFVPTLKRERSSLSIDDRSTASLTRESSNPWQDPRTYPRGESMYAALGRSRSDAGSDKDAKPTVVISHGSNVASRMASKAVNYHSKARRNTPTIPKKSAPKAKPKPDVMKLFM